MVVEVESESRRLISFAVNIFLQLLRVKFLVYMKVMFAKVLFKRNVFNSLSFESCDYCNVVRIYDLSKLKTLAFKLICERNTIKQYLTMLHALYELGL